MSVCGASACLSYKCDARALTDLGRNVHTTSKHTKHAINAAADEQNTPAATNYQDTCKTRMRSSIVYSAGTRKKGGWLGVWNMVPLKANVCVDVWDLNFSLPGFSHV